MIQMIRLLQRYALAAVALMLLQPLCARGDDATDPEAVREAAVQAVRAAAGPAAATLEVKADALDERLRLATCAAPLQAAVGGDGQLRERTTVNVRCPSGTRWSIYVGTSLASEVQVLVAQRALAMGTTPVAADFAPVTRRLPGLSSRYVASAAQLDGQRLRRPVAMGEALAADALALAPIVHRGQHLTLLAHAGSMEVRTTVVAMTDGRPAERIKVQNAATAKVVEAVVRSAELVEVSL